LKYLYEKLISSEKLIFMFKYLYDIRAYSEML